MIALAFGLLGGRLLHVLWEAPEFYLDHPFQFFNILAGGYVYDGGLFLGLVTSLWFLHNAGQNIPQWLDLAAPVLSLGTAFGRIGCLLAGCCYGRACNLPWALQIIDEQGLLLRRHPTPLYLFIWELGVFSILWGLGKTPLEKRPLLFRTSGAIFYAWLILHGVGRFAIEYLRDDFRGFFIYGFSLAQVLAVLMASVGAMLLHRAQPPPMSLSS